MKLKTGSKISFFIAGILVTGSAMAQPSKTTSAYASWDDWNDEENKMSERAITSIEDAKKFIDEAYNFSSDKFNGKQDAKTLYYKGKIYTAFATYMKDETMSKKYDIPAMIDEGVEAYEAHIDLPNKRSKDDKTPEIARDIHIMYSMAWNKANQAYSAENYSDAMKYFANAGRFQGVINVFDSLAYFNAGLCAALAEDWEHSAKYHKLCAQNDYNIAASYARWAEALFKLEKEDEAVAALEEGRAKEPKNPDLYITEGNHWMLKGENAKATAAFQGAIDADPTNASVYYAVGNMQFELEDYENAEKNFRQALKINPNFVDALYGMGAVYNNKAAEIDKEIDNMANFKLMEEKGKERDSLLIEALVYFEKAHEIDPNDKYTLQSLYQIYTKIGEKEKAQRVYDLLKN